MKSEKIVAERQIQNNWVEQRKLHEELKNTDEFRVFFLIDEIGNLRYQMGRLDTQNFTLPAESMQANTYLDRVSNAIEVLIPAEFDQEKFAQTIQQSETLKNTTSSHDGPLIEDVTDASTSEYT